MATLGEFGAALAELDPDAERDDFTFFGEVFAVVGVMPSMLQVQLGAAATGKIDDAEGLAAMWEALRCSLTTPARTGDDGKQVAEDESAFNRFYKLAVAKRADLDSLMTLTFKLFEVQNGRPTAAQLASSDGPRTTSPSSRSSHSDPALRNLRPVSEVLAG